jgi:hypothetical protein
LISQSRGLGDVYKRQVVVSLISELYVMKQITRLK